MPFARPMSGPASRGQTALIAASSSAAQLRGVLPMGVWSTSSTRSMLSNPARPLQPANGGSLPAARGSRPALLALSATTGPPGAVPAR